jgi:hypothetical protein
LSGADDTDVSIGPGARIDATAADAEHTRAAMPTGRHLRDGSVPSGNSRRIHGIGRTRARKTQFVSQPTKVVSAWSSHPRR